MTDSDVHGGCEKEKSLGLNVSTTDSRGTASPSQMPLEGLPAELRKVHDAEKSPKGKTLGLPAHLNSQEHQEAGILSLNAELRKAVMTGKDIAEWEHDNIDRSKAYAGEVDRVMNREYLPAGLAAKETVSKERLRTCIKECESDMMPLDTKKGLKGKVISVQCWNDFKEALLGEG